VWVPTAVRTRHPAATTSSPADTRSAWWDGTVAGRLRDLDALAIACANVVVGSSWFRLAALRIQYGTGSPITVAIF